MSETLLGGTADNTNTSVPAEATSTETLLTSTENVETKSPDVPDTQTQEGQSEEKADGEAQAEAVKGAPEKYELTLPEGSDAAFIEKYESIAKELDLPQDKAQATLDKLSVAYKETISQKIAEVREGWANESRANKEFGGDKLNETLAIAKKAEAYGGDEFRALLKETGLGNHPVIIKTMYEIGKVLSEDKVLTGKAGGGSEKTIAQRMYPTMNP